jgi:hypothetical protein
LTNSGSFTGCTFILAQRQRGRHVGQRLVHLLTQRLQAVLGLRQLVLDAQHPEIRVGIVLLGAALHLVHHADVAVQADDPGPALGRRSAMPDA